MDLANRSHIRHGGSSRPSTSASQPNLRRPLAGSVSAPDFLKLNRQQSFTSEEEERDPGWGGPIRPSTVGTSSRPLPPVRHQKPPRTTNYEQSVELVARSRLLEVGRIVESSVRRRESEGRLEKVKDFERARWKSASTPGMEANLEAKGGGALWRDAYVKHSTRRVDRRVHELQRQVKALQQQEEERQRETKRRTEEREARARERREAAIAERVSKMDHVLSEEHARTAKIGQVWYARSLDAYSTRSRLGVCWALKRHPARVLPEPPPCFDSCDASKRCSLASPSLLRRSG